MRQSCVGVIIRVVQTNLVSYSLHNYCAVEAATGLCSKRFL